MSINQLLRFIVAHPLNKRSPVRALGRFLAWQALSRATKRRIELPFVDETTLLVKRGMTGATQNWYCGLHEPNDMGFLLHFLREKDLFIDVGSNVGSYTVLAAGAVGAHVIAVEPISTTFSHLQNNIRINRLEEKVAAFCIGLSETEGILRFTSGLDTVNHVLADGETQAAVEVEVRTLDDLCSLRVPSLLKIDVEGHELSVLKGGKKTLASAEVQAVIMEVNGSAARYGGRDEALLEFMQQQGFVAAEYNVLTRKLKKKESGSSNTIFVRDIEHAQALTSAARKFRLVNCSI